MRVPETIRKCVAFVGLQMANGEYRIVGTAFFILNDLTNNQIPYVITAKHVIEGIKGKGLDKVFLRINTFNNNSKWVETKIESWVLHNDPTVDIAISPFQLNDEDDLIMYPVSAIFSNNDLIKGDWGIGDEIYIVGLFTFHAGENRNIPIVRVGNIASTIEEKIQTKYGPMDAYLMEARSIGGLSGSPVFINNGALKFRDGKLKYKDDGVQLRLIGMIHGHFDIESGKIDSILEDINNKQNVNTGIGIVTPGEKLISLFGTPELLEFEGLLLKK
jgi:hypothetical protein